MPCVHVRFARNGIHHDWSDAIVLDGLQLPTVLPRAFPEWVWRPADELPEPDKKAYPEAEGVYRQHMEGRSVRGCLDLLGGVFLTIQHLQEPHTIRNAAQLDAPLQYDEEADGYYPFPIPQ
jgi:hypothetical protein